MPENVRVISPAEVQLISRGYLDTTPGAQASTNTAVPLVGSDVDTGGYGSLSYTIRVATNGTTWTVYGADVASYADEVVVQAAAPVAVGAIGSFAVAPPPFRYYRVKIKSTVDDVHGSATVVAHCKV